ncbi:MAG TPA: sugar ABC transporter substrate-binding protein [Roseiflexaceae bacterium]|nr:sugar ABC transporter substrate-binding protein [Roseiflexaceae bacterium]
MGREGNRMTRRQWLRAMAMAGGAALVAACGGTTPPAAQPAAQPAQGSDAAPPAQPQAVTRLSFMTPAALGLERTMYENFVLKFQEENPDIRIDISFEAWGDYHTKLPTMLAGGVVPDVIHQHMSVVQDYGHKNALLDLSPFMQSDGVKSEDYIPALFNAFSDQGKVFALPKDSAAWGVYYNKTMFDEAGVAYPSNDWTLDDFQAIALELTRDEDGNPASSPRFDASRIKQWGFTWMEPTPTASENAEGFVKARGGNWYNAGYSETLIHEPAAIEHFKMFADMRCGQNSIPTPAQATGQGDPFRSGLTAMIVGFHTVNFFSVQENVRFDYDVTYMPSGPGGQFVPVGASGWAIPSQAKNPEISWRFVKYLTSLDVQRYIGLQTRWGVSLREAIDTIIPEGRKPEQFAMVHTDPLKGVSDREVIAFKFPPQQSRIREFYAAEFDGIWTCGGGSVETAAANVKAQVDELLGSL